MQKVVFEKKRLSLQNKRHWWIVRNETRNVNKDGLILIACHCARLGFWRNRPVVLFPRETNVCMWLLALSLWVNTALLPASLHLHTVGNGHNMLSHLCVCVFVGFLRALHIKVLSVELFYSVGHWWLWCQRRFTVTHCQMFRLFAVFALFNSHRFTFSTPFLSLCFSSDCLYWFLVFLCKLFVCMEHFNFGVHYFFHTISKSSENVSISLFWAFYSS